MIRFFVILLLLINSLAGFSQVDKGTTALLVIDIQDFYFPGGDVALSESEAAAENAYKLLKYYRKSDMPVIFIRHNYEPGGSINNIVKPEEGEIIISKSNVNSFLDTKLKDELSKLGIKSLVICGMQTHMCVEAATRAASDLGYECTVIEDACTTRDLKYGENIIRAKDVHYSTLSTLKSYAKIMTTEEFLAKSK